VAESDEMQDSGDEMHKNALAGMTGRQPDSGKM
jgi:hypothetical protein